MWRPTDALHLRDRRQPSMIMPARAQPRTSASVHIFSTLTDDGAEVPPTSQARVDVCVQRRAPGQLTGRLGALSIAEVMSFCRIRFGPSAL